MREHIGLIGIGAMGSALLKGLLSSGIEPDKIIVADAAEAKLQQAAVTYQVLIGEVCEVATAARVLFLAVKPQDMPSLLLQLSPLLQQDQVVVSVAAGVTIQAIEENLSAQVGVIRVMPNTPCLINAGVLAISAGHHVQEADIHLVETWLKNMGSVYLVPEKLLDAVTAVSGSGPAYVYLFLEALADGGVLAGLPRVLAQELAVETVLGAAQMVKATAQHPALLREMVTSPGGTTAAALLALEQGGLRGTLQQAVKAAAERSKELGS
ncbi:MAG TPA: pyrroline-5-carboxylate reductase [Oscillospiraceae bacterium]|nr:pyrroline-5-carboxylate reductase [Oscillospiraceae bacterium]